MNYPSALTFVLGLTLLTACPADSRDERVTTSQPADGGTGEAAAEALECEDEQAKIKALEAELADCRATAPK